MTTLDRSQRTLSAPISTDIDERRARLLKALADPVRQRILNILSIHQGTITVDELVNKIYEHVEVTQPTVSHHLRILYNAGLLYRKKRGTYAYYSVCQETLHLAANAVASLTC
jgi:ArsR family transcriptional regulator, arsenate/arsenite/antimonite-responsive transcriptional repressor